MSLSAKFKKKAAQMAATQREAQANRSAAPAAPEAAPAIPNAPAQKFTAKSALGLRVKSAWLNSGLASKVQDAARDQITKASTAASTSNAGYLLAPQYGDYIEALREKSVLIRAGARVYTYNVSLTLPKVGTGTTGAWVSENTAATDSTLSISQVVLGNKKFTANIKLSNDLLRDPSIDAAGLVGEDIMAEVAAGIDRGFLVGTGSDGQPAGLFSLVHADNDDTADDNWSLATIDAELNKRVADVDATGLDLVAEKAGWLMPTALFHFLKARRDAGGQVYPGLSDASPTLMGYPVFKSNASTSKILFGTFNQICYGVSQDLTTEFDRSGDDMKTDSTTAYGIAAGDIKLRHAKCISVLLGANVWLSPPVP